MSRSESLPCGSILHLDAFELTADQAGYLFSHPDRDRVPKLAHDFAPRSAKKVLIREGLKTRRLPRRKVPNRPVRSTKHVLAARHSVDTGLQGLGRLVQGRTGVTNVRTGSWKPDVIGEQHVLLEVEWLW